MTLRFYHIGVVMCIPSTWTCGGMPVRAAASDDRTCASEMPVGMTTVFDWSAAFRQFLKRVFRLNATLLRQAPQLLRAELRPLWAWINRNYSSARFDLYTGTAVGGLLGDE